MTPTYPLVTVSMPYFNTPKTIRRAVDAVLAQTMPELRLVVINDGDPSSHLELADIADPRLVIFDLPENHGRYFADAVVLEMCESPWFAIHDADDEASPTWLADLLDATRVSIKPGGAIRQGVERADYVSTAQRVQTRDGGFTTEKVRANVTRPTLTHYAHMAGLWRTAWLRDELGGFHPAYRVGYDTLLSQLARMHGTGADLAEPLYTRYFRAGSLTTDRATGMRSAYRRDQRAKLVDLLRRIKTQHASSKPADIVRAEAAGLWNEVYARAADLTRKISEQLGTPEIRHVTRDTPIGKLEGATFSGEPVVDELLRPSPTRAHALDLVVDEELWARPWSLGRGAAAELDRHLAELRLATVVEFGSGGSTLVLARHAARTGARLVVLEHSPEYARRTANALRIEGLHERVDLRLAPLVVGHELGPRYDTELPESIDFALVDGPPEGEGGRGQIIAQLVEQLAPYGEIWLDDAERVGEKRAIEVWRGAGGVSLTHSWGGRSVAVMRRNHPPFIEYHIGAEEVVVTILAGGRPSLLAQVLSSGVTKLGAKVVGALNSHDETSAGIFAAHRIDSLSVNEDRQHTAIIGAGVAHCAQLAIDSGAPYWLHLEDDWVIDTCDDRWLERAIRALEVRAELRQIRLRHVGERVLGYNMLTKRKLSWRADHELGIATADAHWTFNPSLVRTREVAPTFATNLVTANAERRAQELNRGELVAQLYPGAFRHIGEGPASLAGRIGGR